MLPTSAAVGTSEQKSETVQDKSEMVDFIQQTRKSKKLSSKGITNRNPHNPKRSEKDAKWSCFFAQAVAVQAPSAHICNAKLSSESKWSMTSVQFGGAETRKVQTQRNTALEGKTGNQTKPLPQNTTKNGQNHRNTVKNNSADTKTSTMSQVAPSHITC